MASATADDAAKGSPSGKGTAGHHEAGKVREDMVARNVDRNMLAVTHSFRDSKAYARVMISIDFDRGHGQGSNLQPKS